MKVSFCQIPKGIIKCFVVSMIAGDLFDYLVSWVICRLYLSLLSKND